MKVIICYFFINSTKCIIFKVIIIFIDYCLPSNPQMTCHSSLSPVILNLTPSNSQLTSESSNTIPLFLNDGKYWYGNIISCCWHYGMDYALSMDFLAISIYVNAYFKFPYNCKSQHMNVRSNISFHYAIYYTSYINYYK